MIGIDIIRVSRVKTLSKNDTENKVFTKSEVEYALTKTDKAKAGENLSQRDMTYAGIFCAKEAFLKAIGQGLGQVFALNDIEVSHVNRGQPIIVITPKIQGFLDAYKLSAVNLSISHDGEYAVAVVEII